MKKGSIQQEWTQQISTINLISVTLVAQLDLTQVTTLKKNSEAHASELKWTKIEQFWM